MKNQGYRITDWVFFFDPKDKRVFKSIIDNDNDNGLLQEFITWKLLSVFLPLLTFLLVVVLNLITNSLDLNCFFSFVNNGSLPIISFGIISSGMPYLLEQLKDYPDHQTSRRRVMAISLFFLFLSSALYILQTLSIISSKLDNATSMFILILSAYVFIFASSIGFKMFLLQSKNIKPFAEELIERVVELKESVSDLDNYE